MADRKRRLSGFELESAGTCPRVDGDFGTHEPSTRGHVPADGTSESAERLVQVGNDVFGVFQADR